MISNRLWKLYRLSRNISVRISLMALLAVLAAIVAPWLETAIPYELVDRFGAQSVKPILDILTSSMLAVVTFSLSIMVAAHRHSASQSTPRSQRLLLDDTTTQTVLATFLGAFIYALSALILFNGGFYSERAAVVVFGVTVFVVVLVVVAILRWIEHLSHLGSMDETLDRVESAVLRSLKSHRKYSYLRGMPLKAGQSEKPSGLVPIRATSTGYVQNIDMADLQANAESADAKIYLLRVPGDWVTDGEVLAHVTDPNTELGELIAAAITIHGQRSYEQDARFGLSVLSEIAARALSPGINDPGTATDVIGRLERVLLSTAPTRIVAEAPAYDRVFVPALPEQDLMEAAFSRIARDGAGQIEVAERLQSAMCNLIRQRDPELIAAARLVAEVGLAYAEKALPLQLEMDRLRLAAPKGASGKVSEDKGH